jgi:hypothetical protein
MPAKSKKPAAWHREWRANHKRSCAVNRIKYMYDVPRCVASDLYDRSLGTCDVCGGTDAFRKLNVDHSHTPTSLPYDIRGVLCHGCNISIGLLKDNPARIGSLAKYASQV